MENETRWEAVCKTLDKVEKTRSRTQKGMYLQTCSAEFELKRLLSYALDFHNLYGITLEEHGKCTPYEPVFGQFVDTLDTVLQHRTSPAALRDLFEKHPCKWFARVVNHDLRCGLGIKTINGNFTDLIPEFSIQLASPYDPRILLYDTEWVVQPKFDGIRGLIAQFDKVNPQCLSRNGKELFNTKPVLDWVRNMYCALPQLSHHVLDGEFVAEDWNNTITTLHTQSVIPSSDKLKFFLFDAIFLDTFPYDDRTLEQRQLLLEHIQQYVTPESPVQVVKSLRAPTIDFAWNIANELHTRGYEGAIVKSLDSKYVAKRTDAWTKLKFYHECDAEIIGVNEGVGKNKGTLGSLQVRYGRYEAGIGTGFKQDQRDAFWAIRDELLGKKVQISYQELTDNAFRFPVFMRLRDDK